MQIRIQVFSCVADATALVGCIPDYAPKITETMVLNGVEVDVDTLYCSTCNSTSKATATDRPPTRFGPAPKLQAGHLQLHGCHRRVPP